MISLDNKTSKETLSLKKHKKRKRVSLTKGKWSLKQIKNFLKCRHKLKTKPKFKNWNKPYFKLNYKNKILPLKFKKSKTSRPQTESKKNLS